MYSRSIVDTRALQPKLISIFVRIFPRIRNEFNRTMRTNKDVENTMASCIGCIQNEYDFAAATQSKQKQYNAKPIYIFGRTHTHTRNTHVPNAIAFIDFQFLFYFCVALHKWMPERRVIYWYLTIVTARRCGGLNKLCLHIDMSTTYGINARWLLL